MRCASAPGSLLSRTPREMFEAAQTCGAPQQQQKDSVANRNVLSIWLRCPRRTGRGICNRWESLLAHPVSCPTDGVHLSQQMQWTPRGAHLLLQTRAHTLDGTLRPLFKRWYPGLTNDNDADAEQAAA